MCPVTVVLSSSTGPPLKLRRSRPPARTIVQSIDVSRSARSAQVFAVSALPTNALTKSSTASALSPQPIDVTSRKRRTPAWLATSMTFMLPALFISGEPPTMAATARPCGLRFANRVATCVLLVGSARKTSAPRRSYMPGSVVGRITAMALRLARRASWTMRYPVSVSAQMTRIVRKPMANRYQNRLAGSNERAD